MHDLTETARSNDAARAGAAGNRIAADRTGRLGAFRSLVEASTFSTNVSADKVVGFDRASEILDGRRFSIQAAGGVTAAGRAAFTARQDTFLVRREAFEDHWNHGRQIVYGAVNAGGMGTEGRFGPFCLSVGDPETPSPDALAVFPDDSVARYTTGAGTLDGDRAVAEATSWASRADLAVTERELEASAAPDNEWPRVVCRPDQYLEVTRAGALPVSSLSEVRLRTAYRADLATLRTRFVAGELLTPDELSQVAAYDVIREWRRSNGVELVEVR